MQMHLFHRRFNIILILSYQVNSSNLEVGSKKGPLTQNVPSDHSLNSKYQWFNQSKNNLDLNKSKTFSETEMTDNSVDPEINELINSPQSDFIDVIDKIKVNDKTTLLNMDKVELQTQVFIHQIKIERDLEACEEENQNKNQSFPANNENSFDAFMQIKNMLEENGQMIKVLKEVILTKHKKDVIETYEHEKNRLEKLINDKATNQTIKEEKKIELNNVKKRLKEIKEMPNYQNFNDHNKISDEVKIMVQVDRVEKLIQLINRVDRRIFNYRILILKEMNANDNKLECDSYFFTSSIIDFLFVFFVCFVMCIILTIIFPLRICLHFFAICLKVTPPIKMIHICKEFMNMIKLYSYMIPILSFSLCLLIPGSLVLLAQYLCLTELLNATGFEKNEESNSFYVLKILLIFFFFCLSIKEVDSAFNVIGFFVKNTSMIYGKSKLSIPFFLCFLQFLPQIFQIFACFAFSYINKYLIVCGDDVEDLIQNFAALAVVLEFDNYVIGSLKYIQFPTIYDLFYSFFMRYATENTTSDQIKKDMSIKKSNAENEIQKTTKSLNRLQIWLEKLSKREEVSLEIIYLDELEEKIEELQRKNLENLEELQQNSLGDMFSQIKDFNYGGLLDRIPKYLLNFFKAKNV